MFDRHKASPLVLALLADDASLWHACGLTDFAGYLAMGAIGSGADLERIVGSPRLAMPGTDDRLAVRTHDAGQEFDLGHRLMPDPGGPIMFQLHPRALGRGSDVQLPLSPMADTSPDTAHDDEPASDVELAISLGGGRRVPFTDVAAVWVEPVQVGSVQLIDLVDGLADAGAIPLRVRRRTHVDDARMAIWEDLVRVLSDGAQPLLAVWRRADTSSAFRDWAGELRSLGLDAAFAHLAAALDEQTLGPLREVVGESSGEAVASGEDSAPVVSAATDGTRTTADTRRGRQTFPPRPRSASVYACGHPHRAWDTGTCFTCLGAYRSRWRYPA